MDFDAAIRKHAEWKFRLQEAAYQHSQLDTSSISRDDACDLGKWLHSEARSKCGTSPAYARCLKAHAAFHAEAGKVASAVNSRQDAAVKQMLSAGSAFSEASKIVGVALIELKNAAR